jgi:alkanesulfonate monooxygenase SsuD/methylene tetrahydromethanopterin reductase-like flavin-dependent oxidoreductase (luciferase family)
MADYRHDLQFGVFITPLAGEPATVLELARLADAVGLDLVTFQDHPYQPRFLDSWTVLSVVAAQTINVRVAPNVANLPLRPPVVLARSVASLDLLSGGRVELGLGAGFFWEAIAANGGALRTPGQAVDALAEAIDVIRATWATDAGSIHQDGTYYPIDGARPGPAPAHDVEIWLGAYKPRMLALTGAKADGWLPSTGYVELDRLPAANAAIDEAAAAAGRRPEQIRRLLNVSGTFGSGGGFLEGTPSDWAQQLGELTLTSGMSTYIVSAASADDVRRFAEEVAPAVRELVAGARGATADDPAPAPGAPPAVIGAAGPLLARPTPDDGRRLGDQPAWDESSRPTAPAPDPAREYTPREQAAGRHLVDVHDYLRAELSRLRELVGQVAAGNTDPAAVRSYINRMTIRQNNWTLGTFCETYCRTVTSHHMLEDSSVFPHLRVSDEQLAPVIERLEAEHLQIHELLERVDQALIALVAAEGDGIERVAGAIDLLTDALLSHFSYEERELIEPLARLGFY